MPQTVGLTVFDPFPHVAVHVVEAEFVGHEATDRRGESESVAAQGREPIRVRLAGGQVGTVAVLADVDVFVPKAEPASRAAACGILPFRLGQETIAGTGRGAEPTQIGGGIPPVDAGRRMPVVLLESGRDP